MTNVPSNERGSCERSVRDYFGGILDGSVVACAKMRKTAAIVMRQMDAPAGSRWHFSESKAQRHVGFIERFCRQPAGHLGAPLTLQPFQRAILAYVFGVVDLDGNRKTQEVLWIIGRKNGKTTLCAAVELDLLLNDDEGAPEIYNVATKREQAMKGFTAAYNMTLKSPALARHVRKRVGDLFCPDNLGKIQALASNTNTGDGLDVSGAIIDELAAIKNRDLYDLTKQGMSARDNPLLFCITTNGFVREGIFDAQYDYASKWLDGQLDGEDAERFFAAIYELDDRAEWEDESAWPKANPGLGTIKRIDALRANVAKAKNDPSYLPTVLVKDFDLVENQATAWLTYDELHNAETFDLDSMGFKYAVVGFDASDTTDLTACCALMMRPGDDHIYAAHMVWVTEASLKVREEAGDRRGRDSVPYDKWIARGLMRVLPGNIIDKRCAIPWLEELRDKHGIYSISLGYDPWHMGRDDMPTMDAYRGFFGATNCHEVRQGAQTLSQPMKELRAIYQSDTLVDNANPISEWCRSNVMIRTDENGNIAPSKKGQDQRNRIDAFAAELDAWVVLKDNLESYKSLIKWTPPKGDDGTE